MKFTDAIKVAEIIVDALPILTKLLGIGGDKEVATAKAIVESLQDGVDGMASPQAVLAEIDRMRNAIALNDATIDQAAAEKFGQ